MAKAIVLPTYGPDARFVEIDGSLASLQEVVGGCIEPFDVPFDSSRTNPVPKGELFAYVNDEGMYTCKPNRAVYANAYMERRGYLSMLDYSTPVREGDLYTILFGDILIVREEIDKKGGSRILDCTDADMQDALAAFGGVGSGAVEALLLGLTSHS